MSEEIENKLACQNNSIVPAKPLSGYEKWLEEYHARIAALPPGSPYPLGHVKYGQKTPDPSLRKDETP